MDDGPVEVELVTKENAPGRVEADGRGFSLGGGYEFAPHWLVDLTVIVTRPKHDRGSFIQEYRTTTWRLGLVWLLY